MQRVGVNAWKGGAPGPWRSLSCPVVLAQARVSEEVLKGEDRAVITSSWAKGRLVALRFWVGALQIHKARICLIRLHDARHIAPPLRPVQDILGHSANHNNTNSAPSMKSAERSSTHDHMLKNRPREDRGVSSSIARTVNHSASPLGMTIPIGLSSSRGQRAFFGTGSRGGAPCHHLVSHHVQGSAEPPRQNLPEHSFWGPSWMGEVPPAVRPFYPIDPQPQALP